MQEDGLWVTTAKQDGSPNCILHKYEIVGFSHRTFLPYWKQIYLPFWVWLGQRAGWNTERNGMNSARLEIGFAIGKEPTDLGPRIQPSSNLRRLKKVL